VSAYEINGRNVVTTTTDMIRSHMTTWLIRLGYAEITVEDVLVGTDQDCYIWQDLGLHVMIMRVGNKMDKRPKYRAAIY
jgi:hypothetical protein